MTTDEETDDSTERPAKRVASVRKAVKNARQGHPLIREIADVDLQLAELQKRKAALQEELQIEMERLGNKTMKSELDGGRIAQVTLVKGSRLVFHEDELRKKLGAAMWKKVTKQVLDKKLLEDQVALGNVSPLVVAGAAEELPNKPYIKLTIK